MSWAYAYRPLVLGITAETLASAAQKVNISYWGKASMKNACANYVLPAKGNMGTKEQSPDEISSDAKYDSSCPRSDYYRMSMADTMTAAETRVF